MKSKEQLLEEFLNALKEEKLLTSGEIPGIPLYMDQVTTFMNAHLSSGGSSEESKSLTKTMINNYAKNRLIPSPENKKYTKDHMILLIFIFYLKNFLTIGEIETILNPITERYFNTSEKGGLSEIYDEITKLQDERIADRSEDLKKTLNLASTMFEGEADEELLQKFAFISLLSYDVYMKKSLIEVMIEDIAADEELGAEGKKGKKKN